MSVDPGPGVTPDRVTDALARSFLESITTSWSESVKDYAFT